ncbi:heat shock 70 kDa protein 14-like [Adelges cooleyi]|uniref:heat shock 70 kDa protein 14-like n=1 Tax=Adelges cooleyi TaxID=133065 RepID=UPI00217F6387|nr:heat shock 70 kDa protein 14-like [Adelges cooleyi]
MESSIVFGIHVGNSTASIAISKEEGKVDVLANEAGDRITPAVVSITDKETVVGNAAKTGFISKQANTITFNNRLMNLAMDEDEKQSVIDNNKVKTVIEGGHLAYELPLETKKNVYSPQSIESNIYKTLYGIAKRATHSDDNTKCCCVLTVPEFFDDPSRESVRNAATQAGWNVLQVVNAPSVTPFTYGINVSEPLNDTYVLVYRLGGISCDATILYVNSGLVSIKASEHTKSIGGYKLIEILKSHLIDDVKRKHRSDPTENARALAKLQRATEDAVHLLSTLKTANIFIESLTDGVDFAASVSQARFESLIAHLLPSFALPIETVLKKAKLKSASIGKVILCGGPLKIPKLKSYIGSLFPNADIPNGISPDEVLAYGAAVQAGFLAKYWNFRDDLPEPVTEVSTLNEPIEINCCGEVLSLDQNEVLPSTKTIKAKHNSEIVTLLAKIGKDQQKNCEANINIELDEEIEFSFTANTDQTLEVKVQNPNTQHKASALFMTV